MQTIIHKRKVGIVCFSRKIMYQCPVQTAENLKGKDISIFFIFEISVLVGFKILLSCENHVIIHSIPFADTTNYCIIKGKETFVLTSK